LLPLFRAVLVWVVILVTVILPRLAPPAQQSVAVAVSQLTAFDRDSAVQHARNQRVQAAQMAQVQSWSLELKQGLAEYQAKQVAEAAAQAQAEAIAARGNHPAPPPEIARDIVDAFSPLGAGAVQLGWRGAKGLTLSSVPVELRVLGFQGPVGRWSREDMRKV